MKRVIRSLLLFLATATDRELARQVQFLKVENQILRSKLPRCVALTPRERQRLLKFGRKLGPALKELLTIVTLRTFYRWKSQAIAYPRRRPARPGRPRTLEGIRQLILKLARENGWGYSRILGELWKLGIHRISRSTVVNLLKAAGLDPGPKRGEATWDEFLKRHAQSLWATDFLTKRVWTLKGVVEVYVLFFLHLGTRRVILGGITAHPDRVWMAEQARSFAARTPKKPAILFRDFDGKFTKEFDAILAAKRIEVRRVGPCKPNLNAYAERWVQSVKQECLDHFVVFGEAHLRHILTEYLAHYNGERPHQGLGKRPLMGKEAREWNGPAQLSDIVCKQRLGGLLKSYRRKAAA